MINIFPYLEKNYIINDDFIKEFFNKIKTYNFKPEESCGETIFGTLNVYIKNFFEENDNIESEICAIASIIIIIIHEFANYLRLFIYKLTGDLKYKKSIELCEGGEIGDHLEMLHLEIVLFVLIFFKLFLY